MLALQLCVGRPGCKWLLMTAAAGCKLSKGSPKAEPGPAGRPAAARAGAAAGPRRRQRAGAAGQRGGAAARSGARSPARQREREDGGGGGGGRGWAEAALSAGKILSGSCKFATGGRRPHGGTPQGCAALPPPSTPPQALPHPRSGARGCAAVAGGPPPALAADSHLLRTGEPAVRFPSILLHPTIHCFSR